MRYDFYLTNEGTIATCRFGFLSLRRGDLPFSLSTHRSHTPLLHHSANHPKNLATHRLDDHATAAAMDQSLGWQKAVEELPGDSPELRAQYRAVVPKCSDDEDPRAQSRQGDDGC